MSGSYPLPYGVDFGAVLQAYPGAATDDHLAAAGEPVPGRPDQLARRSS